MPGETVSTDPTTALPEMAGSAVLAGGWAGLVTGAVAAEVAVPWPPAVLAVTRTRSGSPTSAASGVYAEAVAPLIAVQLPVLRCHWYP